MYWFVCVYRNEVRAYFVLSLGNKRERIVQSSLLHSYLKMQVGKIKKRNPKSRMTCFPLCSDARHGIRDSTGDVGMAPVLASLKLWLLVYNV